MYVGKSESWHCIEANYIEAAAAVLQIPKLRKPRSTLTPHGLAISGCRFSPENWKQVYTPVSPGLFTADQRGHHLSVPERVNQWIPCTCSGTGKEGSNGSHPACRRFLEQADCLNVEGGGGKGKKNSGPE